MESSYPEWAPWLGDLTRLAEDISSLPPQSLMCKFYMQYLFQKKGQTPDKCDMSGFAKYYFIPCKLRACFLIPCSPPWSQRKGPSPEDLWPLLLMKSLDICPANGVFAPVPHIYCSCSAWLLRSQEQIKLSATNHIENSRKSQERNPVFQSTSQLNWENISFPACETKLFIKPSDAIEQQMTVIFTVQSWFLQMTQSVLVIQEGRVLCYTELLIE